MCAGLSACTTYENSNIKLKPSFISDGTIDWCEAKHCTENHKLELMRCQSNANKQRNRNELEITTAPELSAFSWFKFW